MGPPVAQTGIQNAETTTLTDAMTTPPSAARASLIDACISSLKSAGVWTKLDVLYLFAAADSQAALLNWKSRTFDATLANAPTFAADLGFTGNGSTSYINSGFDPSTAGGNCAQNSKSLGTWANNASTAMSSIEMGNTDNSLVARQAGDIASFRCSATTVNTGTQPVLTGLGLTAVSRNSSTGFTSYKNGAVLETFVRTSIAQSSAAFFIAGRNNAGSPVSLSTRRYAAAYIGGGMSDAENTALYNALNTYLTAVGGA